MQLPRPDRHPDSVSRSFAIRYCRNGGRPTQSSEQQEIPRTHQVGCRAHGRGPGSDRRRGGGRPRRHETEAPAGPAGNGLGSGRRTTGPTGPRVAASGRRASHGRSDDGFQCGPGGDSAIPRSQLANHRSTGGLLSPGFRHDRPVLQVQPGIARTVGVVPEQLRTSSAPEWLSLALRRFRRDIEWRR